MPGKIVISRGHPYFWPIIIASSIGALILITGSFVLISHMFDAPTAVALAAARRSPDFQRAIGEPVNVKFMTTGNVIEKDRNGNADLVIRVAGPHGSGKLREWAQEVNGKWHICSLTLQLADASKNVEIVPDATAPCERE